MNLEPIDTSTTAGKARVMQRDPAPNWCRNCGRLWRDELAPLFCADPIHPRADLAGRDE